MFGLISQIHRSTSTDFVFKKTPVIVITIKFLTQYLKNIDTII